MCVFCKIAKHEIPSKVVYEDDQSHRAAGSGRDRDRGL